MPPVYFCGDQERRAAVADSELNGIDFLEVIDGEAPSEELRQRLLVVRFLAGDLPDLGSDAVRIEGGVRISPVRVLWAIPLDRFTATEPPEVEEDERVSLAGFRAADPQRDRLLVVRTDSAGDYSTYRLSVVFPEAEDVAVLDPRLSAVDFSFKVECPSEFDCADALPCPAVELREPRVDYLAKDYASFRRLIFDRLRAIAPGWRERSPADLGVALVELLAYLGDRLSYFQDAVATEAYLGTARQRASVRRHARLVDYRLHEGSNARVWVQLEAEAAADGASLPGPEPDLGRPGTRLATRFIEGETALTPERLPEALRAGAVIFETLHAVTLHAGLDRIPFYTWSDRECCLPAGATEATLATEPVPGLEPGAFLLFEEVLGPRTGDPADRDPDRRHVVRLTRAEPAVDPLDGTELTEIAWSAADALPFPLCISSRAAGGALVEDVSVARGNLVLADHGLTREAEELAPVPEEAARFFRPRLARAPLTHAEPLPEGFFGEGSDDGLPPAADALPRGPREAQPAVRLRGASGEVWRPRADLLASDRFAREFVAEIDDQGGARLRFGDNVHGRAPAPASVLSAVYRTGHGSAGNLGAEALAHVFTEQRGIVGVRNPSPAAGGVEPEELEEARRFAPQAFRVQRRAVTAEDYARAVEGHPEVQRAAATFRWTGSWYTVFVTLDRRGGEKIDADFERRIRDYLNLYRMAGYDLEVDGPRFVALELEAQVCVRPGYFRSDVRRGLLDAFGSRALRGGERGFFHPDNWSFGQPVYLSQLHAAANRVEGVESVDFTLFKRLGRPEVPEEREQGVLSIGRLEIARLDNDLNFPENGVLRLELGGGQ